MEYFSDTRTTYKPCDSALMFSFTLEDEAGAKEHHFFETDWCLFDDTFNVQISLVKPDDTKELIMFETPAALKEGFDATTIKHELETITPGKAIPYCKSVFDSLIQSSLIKG